LRKSLSLAFRNPFVSFLALLAVFYAFKRLKTASAGLSVRESHGAAADVSGGKLTFELATVREGIDSFASDAAPAEAPFVLFVLFFGNGEAMEVRLKLLLAVLEIHEHLKFIAQF